MSSLELLLELPQKATIDDRVGVNDNCRVERLARVKYAVHSPSQSLTLASVGIGADGHQCACFGGAACRFVGAVVGDAENSRHAAGRSQQDSDQRGGQKAPRQLRTAQTVLTRIVRSSHADTPLTYSRSYSIQVSKSSVERPRTCQRHVSPGLTHSRNMSAGRYWATSRGSGGRGPTRLMSPLRTLISWGSS